MIRFTVPFLFLASVCLAADAPKDDFWRHGFKQESLRGPMSLLPHFQTSQGREGHRFADHRNNKYRLYDFYKRQAEYHLTLDKKEQCSEWETRPLTRAQLEYAALDARLLDAHLLPLFRHLL